MTTKDDISKRKVSKGFIVVVFLLIVAYSCRSLQLINDAFPINTVFVGRVIRDVIFIGIPLGWIVSIHKRVIQDQVRRYLICVGLLIVFWIAVRAAKIQIGTSFEVQSMLWYLYYFPILFIPPMCLFAFMSMGKPEDFKLSKSMHLILIVPTILFLLTVTNNLTQWAFVFLTDPPSTNAFFYKRSVVYYADMASTTLAIIACLVVLRKNARLLTTRQVAIIVGLLTLMALYLAAYGIQSNLASLVHQFVGDMTVVVCLFVMASLELCLRFGLIQNNTHYAELFARIGTPAAILDHTGRVRFVSNQMPDATEVQLWQAQKHPLEIGNGILLESMPIKEGRIVWTEDISQIKRMHSEIKAASEQLAGENDMLRAEVELKERVAATETRNRLYDVVVREISPALEKLNAIAEGRGETFEERTETLKRLCVIGAYVKRRSNLIFLAAEHDGVIPAEELYFCLRESADALKLTGIECVIRFEAGGAFDAEEVKRAYDAFERELEALRPAPAVIEVSVTAREGAISVEVVAKEETGANEGAAAPESEKAPVMPL